MSLSDLKQVIADIDSLDGYLKDNSIPIDIRNEEVAAIDLIKYAMEHEHLIEHIIIIARKCNKLGIKL
jgi:hypothetical protein